MSSGSFSRASNTKSIKGNLRSEFFPLQTQSWVISSAKVTYSTNINISTSLSSKTAHGNPKRTKTWVINDFRLLEQVTKTFRRSRTVNDWFNPVDKHSAVSVASKMEETTGKEEELQKFLGKVDEIGKQRFRLMFDLHFAVIRKPLDNDRSFLYQMSEV